MVVGFVLKGTIMSNSNIMCEIMITFNNAFFIILFLDNKKSTRFYFLIDFCIFVIGADGRNRTGTVYSTAGF